MLRDAAAIRHIAAFVYFRCFFSLPDVMPRRALCYDDAAAAAIIVTR